MTRFSITRKRSEKSNGETSPAAANTGAASNLSISRWRSICSSLFGKFHPGALIHRTSITKGECSHEIQNPAASHTRVHRGSSNASTKFSSHECDDLSISTTHKPEPKQVDTIDNNLTPCSLPSSAATSRASTPTQQALEAEINHVLNTTHMFPPARSISPPPPPTKITTIPTKQLTRTTGTTSPATQHFVTRRRPQAPLLCIHSVLGKGAFGTVYLCQGAASRHSNNQRRFALKVIHKDKLDSNHAVQKASLEAQTLKQVRHPFIIRLADAFQSDNCLYLLLEYAQGGDLFHHLGLSVCFTEVRAKLYLAEITLALGHIHAHNIIYSDLKPENVLLDQDGHVKLTDFGMCSRISGVKRSRSACGTPTYTSPEVVQGLPHGFEVDWWALGVLLFEMLTGAPPFMDTNTQQLYGKILYGPLRVPANVSSEAKSIVEQLLTRNPNRRLGGRSRMAGGGGARVRGLSVGGESMYTGSVSVSGVEQVKQHVFFSDVDWEDVINKRVSPEYVPVLESGNAFDTKYFAPFFTNMSVHDQILQQEQEQQQRGGFTGGFDVKRRLPDVKLAHVKGYRRTYDVKALFRTGN